MIDSDFEEKIGLLLHKGGEVECVCSLGDLLVYIPYLLVEVNENLQQFNMGTPRNEGLGQRSRKMGMVRLDASRS